MARRDVTIPVSLDFSDAEKKLRRFKDKTVRIKLDPKDFNQPLGRITGQLGEFDKSLAASNARVIAFGASASAIYAIQRALSATVKSAIEVEKTLADINVILNSSSGGLKKFGDELFRIAGNTGQSFSEVAKAATELARQGLTVEQTLKRTNNALILTRLSGLDAASSVESLTAAINSFNKSALNSTEIVNKLANVDAAFAVSSKDLAEAIRRVGSTAADANVSFDELVAAVTAAQQTTARGGSVIGNSFKTIFTRLQRPKVLDQLRQIGVETRNAAGETRPLIGILKDLAKTYDGLAPSVKSTTSELIGGVFQINIVKAALADLGKEFSIFDSALKTSISSTDEATKRNEALNQTLSAMLNKTFANLQKVAADAGSDMFSPMLKNLVGTLNSGLSGLADDSETKSAGAKIASGIFKGIGDFLSGPGIILGAVAIFKVVQKIGATANDALSSIILTGKKQEQQTQLKQATFNILQKEPDLLKKILNGTMSIEQAHDRILEGINDETEALRLQMSLASDLASALAKGGVSVSETGPFAGRMRSKQPRGGYASGYKPDWMGETIAMSQHGYSRSDMRDPGVRAERIHDGRGGSFMASVNKHEQVSTVKGPGGKKGTFVIPPKDSDAFRNLKAGGFTPNFAKLGKSLDFSRSGSMYDISGTVGDVLNMYSSRQGIGSPFWKKMKSAYQNNLEVSDMVRMTAKVGGIAGSKNPYHLEELARKQTGSFDPAAKAQGKGRGIRGAKGGVVRTRSGYEVEGAQFYPTDIGSGKYKGFQFSRGDAKRKAGMQTKMAFFKGTIGKNLVASLMEMDPRIQPGKPNGFNEGVKGDVDFVNLGNYLLAMDPKDRVPLSMDQAHNKKTTKNPTLKHGLVSSLMGQGRKKAGGFVPNFATGIYDSDYIPGGRSGKQAILDAITGSGKPIKTVMGASGSGKSTFTAGMGKRITSMGEVGKFNDFVVVYGGGKSRKGGLTAQGKQVFGATTGGVTAVAPSNQEIYSRRIGRLNKSRHIGMPDQRDYAGMKGAMRAPYNQYDFMAGVKKMMQSRGQSFNVVRAGGFIPNFASEALTIKNTKGVTVKGGRAAYDWDNMSESDFKKEYGESHYNERITAKRAGMPYSKWKQAQNRKTRQGETQFIKSPHVMLTADTNFPAGKSTVKKIVDGKNYSVQFPHGGLRKSPAGAGSFKSLVNQEMSGGLSNVYDRLGFNRLETGLGAKQSPDFDQVMRQSNIDQTMGNLFDGLVKKMIRSSSKAIDSDASNTDWDVKSTTGVIAKAFDTKEGLKGDLKLSAYGDGPLDFAEKVLREKGILRTKKRNLASGFMPNFAKGVQKAIMAEKMFGGKNASPVLDYSDELRSKGMSGLFVRDKKQKGIGGVKRDHGGLTNALKDSKRMQGNMAGGFVPNFAKDGDPLEPKSSAGRSLALAFVAPMVANIVAELVPATKNFATSLGEAASIYGTGAALTEDIQNPAVKKFAQTVTTAIAAYTLVNNTFKNVVSKTEEFTKISESATENLTHFQNGIQSYLQNFEAFNSTIIDSNKTAEDVARVQLKMVDSLNQIDSRYRSQIASAKNIEEAQSIQADAMRVLAAETQQVNFATELQKMLDANRSILDVASFTSILDDSNLGKLGDSFFKSISSDAILRANNINSLLDGTQEEIISKLQASFNINPKLAESFGDLGSSEFIEVINEFKQQVIQLQDTKRFMTEVTKLRKEENERLQKFRDAAKATQKSYTDFVNALRASGSTFIEMMSATSNIRSARRKSSDNLAFERGRTIIDTATGLSPSAKAEAEFSLNQSKRNSDFRKSIEKSMSGSIEKSLGKVMASFESTLETTTDPKRASEINKKDTDARIKFNTEFADISSAISNLDPLSNRDQIFNMISELGAKIGNPEKAAALQADLIKEFENSNKSLAEISVKNDEANSIAREQLSRQKTQISQQRQRGMLGGIEGFLNPGSQMDVLSEFTKGQRLQRSAAGMRGATASAARGRGSIMSTRALLQQGLISREQAGNVADNAAGANERRMRSTAIRQLLALRGTAGIQRRRGDASGFQDTASQIRALEGNLRDRSFFRDAAKEQNRQAVGLSDPSDVQKRLASVTADMSKGVVDLQTAVRGLADRLDDGSALNTSLNQQIQATINASAAEIAMDQTRQRLAKEENDSRDKLRAELEKLRVATERETALNAERSILTEGSIGNEATSSFLDRQTSNFLGFGEMSNQELVDGIKTMAEATDTASSSLSQLIAKFREVNGSLDGVNSGFADLTDAAPSAVDALVRGATSRVATNAGGFVPNVERRLARQGGYTAGGIRSMNVGGRSLVYNSNETVKRFPGMSEPAIMPPMDSKAGSNYRSRFGSAHGFDPYMAAGYVPNFANQRRRRRTRRPSSGDNRGGYRGRLGPDAPRPAQAPGMLTRMVDDIPNMTGRRGFLIRKLLSDSFTAKVLKGTVGSAVGGALGSGYGAITGATFFSNMGTDTLRKLAQAADKRDYGRFLKTFQQHTRGQGLGGGIKNLSKAGLSAATQKIGPSVSRGIGMAAGGARSTRNLMLAPGRQYFGTPRGVGLLRPGSFSNVGISGRMAPNERPRSASGRGFGQVTRGDRIARFSKDLGRGLARGGIAAAADYGVQYGFDQAGVSRDTYGGMATRGAGTLAVGAYFGGPVGMALAGTFYGAQQTAETLDMQGAQIDRMFGGANTLEQQRKIGRSKMGGSGVAISPVIKKYRALQQNKANIEEAIQRNEGYRGMFDIIGDDDFDVENAKRSLAVINAKLQKDLPGFQNAIKKRRKQLAINKRQKDPRYQAEVRRQQHLALVRRFNLMRKKKERGSTSTKTNTFTLKHSNTAQELLDAGINLTTGRSSYPTKEKARNARPSITAGMNRPKGGDYLNPNIYASKEDRREAFRQGISLGQLYTNENRFIDETGKNWNDMRKEFSGSKSRSNWTYRAGGYVPNFEGINDAVRREIRDGGVSRNQVRVHLNPDAVTNTRDEPRGLKDVPNYANSEEMKQVVSALTNMVSEISALRQQPQNLNNQEVGESTVRHINSPLSINVSGNIQETNSNIDEQVFKAVVKAVEKLRGGQPISPPKANEGQNNI
mgnify:CR=1 FL=1